MEHKIQNKLALFAANTQAIKKEFPWQDSLTKRLAALIYAQDTKPIDCESIRQCHDLIKQNTGAFSTFRGNMALCLAALLSLSPGPQRLFSETLKVYDLLKGVKFRASDYLVVAAYQIAAQSNSADYPKVVNRTRAFYDDMKARHSFYTGEDDYIYTAMLGLSDLNVTAGIEGIERLYSRLKGEFRDKNSVQALSQVLVLGGSDDACMDRVLALRNAFKAEKIRLDKSFTLPVLGILALLPVEFDLIVRGIIEAQQALLAEKGFGPLSVTTQELLLFAATLVASGYGESIGEGVLTATLSTSITNIIIAQQAAMIAAITASTVAVTVSSSS